MLIIRRYYSITFRHEKPGHVWCVQVFSIPFDYLPTREIRTCMMSSGILITIWLPSDMRNEDMYDVFRYSHYHLITFRHEKGRHVWCLQVFSLPFDYLPTWETKTCMMSSGIFITIRLPSDMTNEDMYDVFKYSHYHSITFWHEKRGHVWCLQVFSWPFDYLPTWETKTCMTSSGILIRIRLPSDMRNENIYDVFRYSHYHLSTFRHEKWGHVWCLQGVWRFNLRQGGSKIKIWMMLEDSKKKNPQKESRICYDILRYSSIPRIVETELYYVDSRYSRIWGLKIPSSYITYWIMY